MSSKFRKFMKFVPQFFTILGAISVTFAMLLSIVYAPVQAEPSTTYLEKGINDYVEITMATDILTEYEVNQVVIDCVETATPTNTPSSTATNTPVTPIPDDPTATSTPTSTATSTPTSTATSTPTSTATSTPTSTATSTPTSTATSTPTSTATSTPTSTATSTPVTPTPEDPKPTPEDPTATPTDPENSPTPDKPDETPTPGEPTPTPPNDTTPDPTKPPTLQPPITVTTPFVLIPVTGAEFGNGTTLDFVRSIMFNMGLGFLGLGLVLQSLRKKLNY